VSRPTIDNPIINSPYSEPQQHWAFDDQGLITSTIERLRRPSESWVPVPPPRKGRRKAVQTELDLGDTTERRRKNEDVDRIRNRVRLWRQKKYPDVTPTTRMLLEYWSNPERDNKIMFCQREAAETAIYLAESAAKQGDTWISNQLADHNREYNDGLPRTALKMATGSGKTVVMAMLIAWQTLNKVASPNDKRFSKRFLVVTPGITIRDRLRVLLPADDGNYYRLRDLVPADRWGQLRSAEIVITNFHTFTLRATKEGRSTTTTTKQLLAGNSADTPFVETPAKMVTRVLREFSSGKAPGSGIVVLNDEAHHCYRPSSAPTSTEATTADQLTGEERRDATDRNKDAGLWFSGLRHVAAKVGVKAVYDLSATPYFLKGSGYPEGYLFPWVVTDFSLMDAIEAGVVKIPRVPVDDDSSTDEVAYLHLWPRVGPDLPKKLPKGAVPARDLPPTLEGAVKSLYRDYARDFERWQGSDAARRGETPPVFIVVCNNTTVSRMVYEFIAGREVPDGEGRLAPGELPLLSNVVDGAWLAKPRTILVDSAQLESGEALTPEFRAAAVGEIEAFRTEYAHRTNRQAEDLDDADLLREVMNTVGKPDRLGEGVRCVVSVSMLTEGWDANTVTHILGVRAFGSQLLCEQVVGRGLRRRSYAVNDDGMFEPEYAQVYGVPFKFIRLEPGSNRDVPSRPITHVRAIPERAEKLRIVFPNVEGYRTEVPDDRLYAAFDAGCRMVVSLDEVPSRVEVSGQGGAVAEHRLGAESVREAEIAFRIAKRLLTRWYADAQDQPKRWLFPQLVAIVREWLRDWVTYAPGAYPGLLTLAEYEHLAAERVSQGINWAKGSATPLIRPLLRPYDSVGSTDDVDFSTSRKVYEADETRSPVNYVVLDGKDGNDWEQTVAETLESMSSVASYVKNDHLELVVPYVHAGKRRRYLPDFVVRLVQREDDVERHLLVEVSGTRKSATMTKEKADTARNLWCASVNNHGGFGRWGFIEIRDPSMALADLEDAVKALYADGPITGLPS
jgi:type III restriction enzyme